MFFSGDEVKRFAQQVDVGTLNLCFLGPSASFSSHLTRFHVGIWVDVKRGCLPDFRKTMSSEAGETVNTPPAPPGGTVVSTNGAAGTDPAVDAKL